MATQEEIQELANRGLQDQLPPEKRQVFDELVGRGVISLPEQAEPSFTDKALGVTEGVATLGSALVAEPVAGITGLAKSITSGTEAGQDVSEQFREALTFEATSPEAKGFLASAGEVVKPVGEAFQFARGLLGDSVFEATGSPTLATAASILPDVILEGLGLKGTKLVKRTKPGPGKRAIQAATKKAAPSIDQIKPVAKQIFKEVDDLGATIKSSAVDDLAKNVNASARELGFNPRINDRFAVLLEEINAQAGKSIPLTKLDEFRKIAQGFAGNIDRQTKALGMAVIDNIDDVLISKGAIETPKGLTVNVGKRLKVARELWGRVRKAEVVDDIFVNARRAQNFERSIRNQIAQLLKSKKRIKFFSKLEKQALDKVTSPKSGQRFLELLGKFGIDKDAALIGLLGGSAGGAVGGAGVGFLIPAIGTAARQMAKRMLRGNADFAEAFIRAGNKSDKIVSAYLKFTSRGQRTAEELSTLLLRPDIDLGRIGGTQFLEQAKSLALNKRQALSAVTANIAVDGQQTGSDQGSIAQREAARGISREKEQELAESLGF